MKLKIIYKKIATKFIKKNTSKISKNEIDELIVKSMKKIINREDTNVNLKKLVDNQNEYFRVRKGNIRIIFSYSKDGEVVISIVEDIGFRGDIYK
jgi:mRNA-degrading endonuclease RelE of RelBE toxin-antitoxin system